MKKVLIFSLVYYPNYIGGAEVAIKEITDRIPDIEFHMVTLRFDRTLPKVEKVGNMLVHRIGFTRLHPAIRDLKTFPLHYNKFLFQLLAAYTAQSLHRRYRYDAIWAMMAHATGVPAALFKMRNPAVPFILTLQEGDPPKTIERTMRPLWYFFSKAFTSADIVQAISSFLGAWARRRGFRGPLEVIPNGVNTQLFSAHVSSTELRTRLGKKESDVYLITTSRLVHKNAIDDVLRALALLPTHVQFLILGSGPDKEELMQLAEDLGVATRIQWLDQVSHDALPQYLQVADIFIRPSRSEGMGNSFIEAMAAGIPVIATQEGGIADFLFDAQRNPSVPATGWAVDVNAPEQIAHAVEHILAHPEEVTQTVTRAQAFVREKYDWKTVVAAMQERVFKAIL